MRVEITIEDGDYIKGLSMIYKGPPVKFVKHFAKHEWEKLIIKEKE